VVDALNINLEHTVEVPSGSSIDPPDTRNTRIIDEDVDALTRQQLAEDAVNLGLICHVAGVSLGYSAGFDNPLCRLLRAVQSQIDDVDDSTRAGELRSNGKTDSAGASGNNGGAAVEPKLPRSFWY
jgi:hypothetical protein